MKIQHKASTSDLGYRLNEALDVARRANSKAELLQTASDLHKNLIKAQAGLDTDSELFVLLDDAAHFINTCKV
jgi:hypothetical protein